MTFEWDEGKADANLIKHGVSFEEAAGVFRDPLYLVFSDPAHSIDEQRFISWESLAKEDCSSFLMRTAMRP